MLEIAKESLLRQMTNDLVESFSYDDPIWKEKGINNVKVEDFYIDFYDEEEKKIYDCMDFCSIDDPEEKSAYLWGSIEELEPIFNEALKNARIEFRTRKY